MLIRFKKRFEKIAMGLLSFMPDAKEVKKLQDIIKEYEENDAWQLFLWKEDDDVLGAIGLKIDSDHKEITVQHISVDPSHRNLGIGTHMVKALSNFYDETYEIIPNEQTARFLEKCNGSSTE
ncbi:riboflavin biosynthesis RibT protein [Gracilibacillus halotolerans]|uniref:Riboflavin biosynthesis RibT protein n=1 Tax=Gracilibacillus halotolerans TaxID=74386 RepID=A0A841RKH3_9BACI|nr:GNAT family N-acetyltransferase [Gracilibacillus halotolerans]MBB6511695.1 riboflavin biosynthesis RibT protein [Gracilibacillus halotolerans]